MKKVVLKFVDLFTFDAIEVGIFKTNNSKVELDILPAAYSIEDSFLIPILEGMQKNIFNKDILTQEINSNVAYTSLQFFYE